MIGKIVARPTVGSSRDNASDEKYISKPAASHPESWPWFRMVAVQPRSLARTEHQPDGRRADGACQRSLLARAEVSRQGCSHPSPASSSDHRSRAGRLPARHNTLPSAPETPSPRPLLSAKRKARYRTQTVSSDSDKTARHRTPRVRGLTGSTSSHAVRIKAAGTSRSATPLSMACRVLPTVQLVLGRTRLPS